MRAWVEVGLDPDSFWDKTPLEASIIIEARWARELRKQNQIAWLAWHIAALSRVKKMPKLQTMLVKRPERGRQTWQEQLTIMHQWAAVERNRAQRGK